MGADSTNLFHNSMANNSPPDTIVTFLTLSEYDPSKIFRCEYNILLPNDWLNRLIEDIIFESKSI